MNSKLHAICDGLGRPLILMLTEGQMSDHRGAQLLFGVIPDAKALLADKGYDSNALRDLLKSRGIEACIPPTAQRKVQFPFDKELYKRRHKIENMFGRLKDWRRVSTRYDRCAHTFMSAIKIAATMIFWINQ